MTLSIHYLLFLLILLIFNVRLSSSKKNKNKEMNYDNFNLNDFEGPRSDDYTYTNNCTNQKCVSRAEKKLWRIEKIKNKILNTLGLEAPPNITKPRSFSGPVLTSVPIMPDSKKLVQVLKYSKRHDPTADENNLNFTFNDNPKVSQVTEAYLKVFIQKVSNINSFTNPVTIKLYKVRNLFLMEQKTIQRDISDRGEWIEFEVLNLVKRSIAKAKDLILNIGAFSYDGQSLAVFQPSENDDDDNAPHLNIFTEENVKRRNKRKTEGLVCNDISKEERCCRWPLEVDFSSFGWYFIIQPQKYKANYCDGKCATSGQQGIRHAHIVLQSEGFESCCIATKMLSLDLIFHKDEDTIVRGNIADMIADKCMCA